MAHFTSQNLNIIAIYYRLCLIVPQSVHSLDLVASISQRGVKGQITFTGGEAGEAVLVTADLEVSLGSEGEYTWGIYEFPIDYTKVSWKRDLSPTQPGRSRD